MRDTRVLMGLLNVTEVKDERARLDSFFGNESVGEGDSSSLSRSASTLGKGSAPPRPSKLGRTNLGRVLVISNMASLSFIFVLIVFVFLDEPNR
jgi:hypothetical protein